MLLATTLGSPAARADEVAYDDYKVSVYSGRLAEPRLSKAMCQGDEMCFWNFRTRLRSGANTVGVTFGGRYTLVEWGCGTSCQSGAVIDRKTGRMVWLPTASLGYEYRADSTLLVVNPYPREYAVDGELPDWLYREFYVLMDGQFLMVSQDKGDLLDTPHPIDPEVLKELEKAVVAKFCENNPHACTKP